MVFSLLLCSVEMNKECIYGCKMEGNGEKRREHGKKNSTIGGKCHFTFLLLLYQPKYMFCYKMYGMLRSGYLKSLFEIWYVRWNKLKLCNLKLGIKFGVQIGHLLFFFYFNFYRIVYDENIILKTID